MATSLSGKPQTGNGVKMPDTALLVEPLDIADLKKVIPCSIGIDETWRTCAAPAVARVKNNCPCGKGRWSFLCQKHLDMLRNQRIVVCGHCDAPLGNNWQII